MADYDVIVIGGGATGFIAGTLLQKRGKKVLILEKNDYIGGLACNMHRWPGYTHNTGMWYLMFARLGWMDRELELTEHGLELLYPKCTGVVMAGYGKNRKPYKMFMDQQEQMEYIGHEFGNEVVQEFGEFYQSLAPFQTAMSIAMEGQPMSIGEMMAQMPIEGQQAMKKLFYLSAHDYVDEFFHGNEKAAAIRGQMMGLATDGFYGSINTPGSAFTLAYHATTPESGSGGSPYRFPKGHTGAFVETIRKTFEDHGGEVRTGSPVARILVKDNTAVGVRLEDGTEISCDKLVSSLDPYNNFVRLTDEKDISPFFRSQLEDYKNEDCNEHIAQLSLCMNKLPTFSDEFADLNEGDWRFQVWTFDPDVAENCWQAVNNHTVYKDTFATGLYFPNMMDPSLAPEGKYTATICAQYAWPLHTPKEKVDDQIKASTEMIINSYSNYMPDFRDCIDDVFLNCPPYWESEYGVTGGTWTHGMIKLDNILNFRPVLGLTDFRGPFKNMYLCGTSNHPGLGVTGYQPRNAVKALLEDEGEQLR